METVVVQIGNSDDKLPQSKWAEFIMVTDAIVARLTELHFSGGSNANAPWQNYCWVGLASSETLIVLEDELGALKKRYSQDSIALTVGATEFI